MRMTWLMAPLLVLALVALACGDNDTNQELDEARGTASSEETVTGSATTLAEETPDGDATAGTDETPDADGTPGEDSERINLNIRSPKDGDVVNERRPTIEIFVRNASLR